MLRDSSKPPTVSDLGHTVDVFECAHSCMYWWISHGVRSELGDIDGCSEYDFSGFTLVSSQSLLPVTASDQTIETAHRCITGRGGAEGVCNSTWCIFGFCILYFFIFISIEIVCMYREGFSLKLPLAGLAFFVYVFAFVFVFAFVNFI